MSKLWGGYKATAINGPAMLIPKASAILSIALRLIGFLGLT